MCVEWVRFIILWKARALRVVGRARTAADAHVIPEVQKAIATKMDEILAPSAVATTVATKGVLNPVYPLVSC